MLTAFTRHLPAALSLAALAAVGSAQQSEAQLRDELAFARGLATRWGFVDLSERVLERVEKASGLPPAIAQEAAIARAEVYYAAGISNSAKREELFGRAIEAYDDFIARNPGSDFLDRAESDRVRISAALGKALSLKLQDSTGEEALALRERLRGVLIDSLKQTQDLILKGSSIPASERSEADRLRLFELMLQRAEFNLELARLATSGEEGGKAFLTDSYRAYESLVTEATEATPYGLRGFIGMGDVKLAEGKPLDAADFYVFVVETAIPKKPEDQAQLRETLDAADLGRRFLFVQLALPGLLEAYQQAGKTAEALEWGLHFYNLWKQGLPLHDLFGPLAQLALARTLLDAGGFISGDAAKGQARWTATQAEAGQSRALVRPSLDMALSLAQQVNAENKGNTLQVRAQKVIAEIITRPGVQVAPEVLFEAALGDYNERNFTRALEAFRRVLAALEHSDPAKRTEIGSKVMWHIGRSLQQLNRPLEAAVAYETAVRQWSGDPQYDELNANRFYEAANTLKRQIKDDPVIEALFANAENVARQYKTNIDGAIQLREAEALFDRKKYAEAKSKYGLIGNTAAGYEEAQVMVGVCDYHLGAHPAAQKVFRDYLEVYVNDPAKTPNTAAGLAARQKASAAATYYWGMSAFDTGDFKRAVQLLDGFHVRFPNQDSLAPIALRNLMEAYNKLDDTQAMLDTFEILVKTFPDSPSTANAATTVYRQLGERHEREQDPERKRVLLRQMADNMRVINRIARTPTYTNLRLESKHWADLAAGAPDEAQAKELWAIAEEVLNRTRTLYAAADAEAMQTRVLPDLGRALLAQYKVQEAAEVLRPLTEGRPSREVSFDYARALTGWIEFSKGETGQPKARQVPGVGSEQAFTDGVKILTTLQQAAQSQDSYGPDDYRYRAALIYALHQWGRIDGKKLEDAKTLLDRVITSVGANFDDADRRPEGDTLQSFLWLKEKLK